MAKSIIRPYDRNGYSLEKILGVALFISLGLHVLASWFFLFVLPEFENTRKDRREDIITVQLMGGIPAPAAPNLPVNPELKGPDTVEVPATMPSPPPQPVVETPSIAEPVVTPPEDVIPIAPAPIEPPIIKKTEEAPPKVTPPPPKVQEKPKEKPKPRTPSIDSQINQRLRELERKTQADNVDDAINQRIMDIARSRGGGQGESSAPGSTSGVRLAPEKEAYYRHIRDIVSKNWVAPAGAMSANLSAVYVITIEPSGRVSASRLAQRSGNPDYDLSVERAVKMSTFPPLPPIFGGAADSPALRFRIEDMRQGG